VSIRQHNPGSIVKPGFNPLAAQTTTTYYDQYSWGYNNQGQLGLGDIANRSSPTQVGYSLEPSWSSLANGFSFSAAVKTDGTMWTWGNNGLGQLGLGNTTNYSSPKQVGSLTTWSKVFAGPYSFNCYAVKTDGTFWAWGYGISLSLGQGNTTSYSSPKQIGALTNWSTAASGFSGSVLAVKTDGTLWGWGYNQNGQIGITSAGNYVSSPTQIGALTNWLQVAATGYFTTAVKTDGTIWSWGNGSNGKLGLGNTTTYSSPKQIGALTNWQSVRNGLEHVVSVTTSGRLYAWGFNSAGQLGDGTITNRSSPVQIGSLTTWSILGTGSAMSAAIKTDGTLWSWGYGLEGGLGHGNTTTYSSPKQIGSSTWTNVSCGYQFMIAVG
jgi:alpha-tubulin suppressor-like RCC1 family protein